MLRENCLLSRFSSTIVPACCVNICLVYLFGYLKEDKFFNRFVLNLYLLKQLVRNFFNFFPCFLQSLFLTDLNECATNNGGCNQMCCNTFGGHFCKCRSGFHLDNDQRTCIGKLICFMLCTLHVCFYASLVVFSSGLAFLKTTL